MKIIIETITVNKAMNLTGPWSVVGRTFACRNYETDVTTYTQYQQPLRYQLFRKLIVYNRWIYGFINLPPRPSLNRDTEHSEFGGIVHMYVGVNRKSETWTKSTP